MDSAPCRVSKQRNTRLSSELEKLKDEIQFLYCVERRSLKDLTREINKNHHLEGRPWQYRDRLAAWGFRRNLKKSDWVEAKRQLLEKGLGQESVVYLNGITDVTGTRLKRGLNFHVTATDLIFLKANAKRTSGQMVVQNLPETIGNPISVQTLPSWNEITLPPIRRNLPVTLMPNLPISITGQFLFKILHPMIARYSANFCQISTVNANKYCAFLKTFVYAISNGIIGVPKINDQLDLIKRLYRQPFKALLSLNSVSIEALCQRLLPILYIRGDECLIVHLNIVWPGILSHFSLLASVGRDLYNMGISTIRNTPGKQTSLRGLLNSTIKPENAIEAMDLLRFCCFMEDLTPFNTLTSQSLLSSLVDQESRSPLIGVPSMAPTLENGSIELFEGLLKAGFKHTFAARLLAILFREEDEHTQDSWLVLWRSFGPTSQMTAKTCNTNSLRLHEKLESFEFDWIYTAVLQILRSQIQTSDWYESYSDIIQDFQCSAIPEEALVEIALVGRLIVLKADASDFLLDYLQKRYPSVELPTYILHTILRSPYYHPHYLLDGLYGHMNNYLKATEALKRFTSRRLNINLRSKSLVSPVGFIVYSDRFGVYRPQLEISVEILDLLLSAGADPDAPYRNYNTQKPNIKFDGLQAIDIAFQYGENPILFCHLLSRNASTEHFLLINDVLDPSFRQAVYHRDLKYIQENWLGRFQKKDKNRKLLTLITEDVIESIKVERLLTLEGYIPSDDEVSTALSKLIRVHDQGRQTPVEGPAYDLMSMILKYVSLPYTSFLHCSELSIDISNFKALEIILSHGFLPHERDQALLLDRAIRKNLLCLKAMVNRGFNININHPEAPSAWVCETTLTRAILYDILPAVAYLLQEGADIYAGPGVSPLQRAILSGKIDSVSLMLQAEPTCKDYALAYAEECSNVTIARYIRSWKPNWHENTTHLDIEMYSDIQPDNPLSQYNFGEFVE